MKKQPLRKKDDRQFDRRVLAQIGGKKPVKFRDTQTDKTGIYEQALKKHRTKSRLAAEQASYSLFGGGLPENDNRVRGQRNFMYVPPAMQTQLLQAWNRMTNQPVLAEVLD